MISRPDLRGCQGRRKEEDDGYRVIQRGRREETYERQNARPKPALKRRVRTSERENWRESHDRSVDGERRMGYGGIRAGVVNGDVDEEKGRSKGKCSVQTHRSLAPDSDKDP